MATIVTEIYKKPSLLEKAKFRLEQIKKEKEKILNAEILAIKEIQSLENSGK